MSDAARRARELLAPFEGRCLRCGWPLADSREQGCVPGNCSYRPDDPAERARLRLGKQLHVPAQLLAELADENSRLAAENERLTQALREETSCVECGQHPVEHEDECAGILVTKTSVREQMLKDELASVREAWDETIANQNRLAEENARLAARVWELESAIAGAGEMHGELTEAYCARNASVVALTAELAEANRKLDLVLWECPECSFRFDRQHDHIDGSHSCPNCAETTLRAALEPLACCDSMILPHDTDDHRLRVWVTAGEIRAARVALARIIQAYATAEQWRFR